MTLKQRAALKNEQYWDEERGKMLHKLTNPTTGISDEYWGETWREDSNRFWEEHGEEVQALLHNPEFMEWQKDIQNEYRQECRDAAKHYYEKLAKARDAVKKHEEETWTTTSACSSE